MSIFKTFMGCVGRNSETIKTVVLVAAPVAALYILDVFVSDNPTTHRDCMKMDEQTLEALMNGSIVAYMLKDGDICKRIIRPTD